MTANEFKMVHGFEGSLVVGDVVVVCWTSSGRRFRGRGNVAKINGKSFIVRLIEHVGKDFYGGYSAGHRIKVPRIEAFDLWSCNNRVEPEAGYLP